MATSVPHQQVGHSVCHVGGFHLLVEGKDDFKNDFQILGMKFAKKSIFGPKWKLTQNVRTKSAFSPKKYNCTKL